MSTQLALDYAPHKLARAGGSATSLAAAHAPKYTNRQRVLDGFRDAHPYGMTYEEAAYRAGLAPHEVTKRISDLIALDLIEAVGERELSSGKHGRVYYLTNAGMTA